MAYTKGIAKKSKCRICGKSFYSQQPNARLCSDFCRYKFWQKGYMEKKRKEGKLNIKKNCNFCGKEFTTNNNSIKYCSDECREIYYKQKHKERIENGYFYKGHNWLKFRFEILKRDGFKCQYCGRNPRTDKNVILHIDHIIPRSKCGNDEIDNLITSCFECNQGKKDVLLDKRLLENS